MLPLHYPRAKQAAGACYFVIVHLFSCQSSVSLEGIEPSAPEGKWVTVTWTAIVHQTRDEKSALVSRGALDWSSLMQLRLVEGLLGRVDLVTAIERAPRPLGRFASIC